jgi:hypothetical protein
METVHELEIDWQALHSAFQMAMPEVRCFLSLDDGKVVKLPPGAPELAAAQAARDRFVAIDTVPSRIQYQWVDEFSKSIEDESLRVRVEAAINGKGAFRRFKDILLTIPDERRRWFEFRDHKMRERISEWVREKGIEPLNDPPWVEDAKPSVDKPKVDPRDVEALRDFLIEWADGKDAKALEPLSLEALATAIAEKFKVKPL